MPKTPDNTTPARSRWIDPIATVIWLVPLAFLLYTFPSLPDRVPMHFDGNGKPDGFGSKQTHLWVMLGMWVFNLGIYLVVRNIHRLDPKATVRLGQRAYSNLALAILLFLSILHVVIVYATRAEGFVVDRLLFVLLGAFFAYLGWIMRDIEPNYFVGIRTPWTLEDPENWRVTHDFGGRWFLWGGSFIALASLVLPRPAVLFTGIAALLLIAIVPIAYSWRYFARNRRTS